MKVETKVVEKGPSSKVLDKLLAEEDTTYIPDETSFYWTRRNKHSLNTWLVNYKKYQSRMSSAQKEEYRVLYDEKKKEKVAIDAQLKRFNAQI